MKHSKLSCLLLVAMLCISLLSGCGNKNPNQPPTANPSASADNTGAPSQSGANENEAAAEMPSSMVTGTLTGEEDVRGFAVFGSDDANSGEFTYFCLAPDTMDTTWHIEFRYGSDLDALNSYDSGDYAYRLASGISADIHWYFVKEQCK